MGSHESWIVTGKAGHVEDLVIGSRGRTRRKTWEDRQSRRHPSVCGLGDTAVNMRAGGDAGEPAESHLDFHRLRNCVDYNRGRSGARRPSGRNFVGSAERATESQHRRLCRNRRGEQRCRNRVDSDER